MDVLEKLEITGWRGPFSADVTAKTAEGLEKGKILFAPLLHFELSETEKRFLSPIYLDPKSKNISFRPSNGALGGSSAEGRDREDLTALLGRYYESATALITGLCPPYRERITPGFTSFRPARVEGRATSWRKDDSRLHVDAFPSRPLQGLRILRVFTNVNPSAPRDWRVGEPFEDVAKRFLPEIRRQVPGSGWMLHKLGVVKSVRTEYDHLMLGIHDRMKADDGYQSGSEQVALAIPAGATWACYTDLVPHAAMAGQFAFEQTFYVPVEAMEDESRSPLRVLERLTNRKLA
ncbi:MAG TPA: Kdo hydroxylase family protein [Bryobacteraceae bacterium]|nr:Kdo hydroxylase family protein [Bryobacteraceae bacterium]